MPARLLFPDAEAAADLMTFAGRAARLGDAAVRLRGAAGQLVTTSAPLSPQNLLDPTPTVLGLRILPVDPELECDLVVAADALRRAPDAAAAVELPPTALTAPWAGISPPRGGWEVSGSIAASVLAARAQWGIAAVADQVPAAAAEEVVRVVRAQVWGAPDPALGGMPLGVAFAAFALGFIAGEEEAVVRTAGAWTRVSLARGHVLTRTTVRSGLTPVRATGAA